MSERASREERIHQVKLATELLVKLAQREGITREKFIELCKDDVNYTQQRKACAVVGTEYGFTTTEVIMIMEGLA